MIRQTALMLVCVLGSALLVAAQSPGVYLIDAGVVSPPASGGQGVAYEVTGSFRVVISGATMRPF